MVSLNTLNKAVVLARLIFVYRRFNRRIPERSRAKVPRRRYTMSGCGCSCGCSCGSSCGDYGGGGSEGYSSYYSGSSSSKASPVARRTAGIVWLVGTIVLILFVLTVPENQRGGGAAIVALSWVFLVPIVFATIFPA